MRKLAVVLVSVVAGVGGGLVLSAGPAEAGCCLVVILDPMDKPEPGEEVTVGFTVRINQTPTDELARPGEPIGLSIYPDPFAPAGAKSSDIDYDGEFFPARREEVGHYVADVELPEAGTYNWAISGQFGVVHDLGTLTVGDDPAGGGDSVATPMSAVSSAWAPAEYRGSILWRVVLPIVTVLTATYAAVELVAHRRRSPATVGA